MAVLTNFEIELLEISVLKIKYRYNYIRIRH